NPLPYPVRALAPELWARLPDRELFQAARHAALAYFAAPADARIVEAAGSQALIQALPWLVPRGRVAVAGFTYAEHERCWRGGGHPVMGAKGLGEPRRGPRGV